MMATHTEQCIKMQAEYEKYLLEHPNYCRDCQGDGFITVRDDPSPPGVSLGIGAYTWEEPCIHCFAIGKCPVCGSTNGWFFKDLENCDTFVCSDCSWHKGKEGAPYWECECGQPDYPDY